MKINILTINEIESETRDLEIRVIKNKAKAVRCFHNAIRKHGADSKRIVEMKDEKTGDSCLQCHSTQGGDFDSLCITLWKDMEVE